MQTLQNEAASKEADIIFQSQQPKNFKYYQQSLNNSQRDFKKNKSNVDNLATIRTKRMDIGDHNKNMGLAADKLMKLNHSQLESATVNYESSINNDAEQKIDAPQSGWIASTVKQYSHKKMHGKN